MNKTILAMTMLVVSTAQAQSPSLEQVSKDLAEIKARNERLEAEVEYLKEQTKGQRKEAAIEAVEVANLKSAVSKFTWSGDFRYRNEQIETAQNASTSEYTQGRDRIRLRFGVTAKINDTVAGRFQISTAANNDPRSTNQTLGEDWSRKSVGVDLAYVDWKPFSVLNVQLGKTPQPWQRTSGYFWDGDLTPEGAAVKFASGPLFVNAFYNWLNERHSSSATGARSDSKLVGGQVGWKQPVGPVTLTAAAGYFDLSNVQDEQVTSNAGACTGFNATFFGGSSTSTNGNLTHSVGGCTRLLSDFTLVNALLQADVLLGNYPLSAFVDVMRNTKAEPFAATGEKLDTAYAVGVTFNKASNPKTWEAGVVYQQSEADAVFGQFHDSDFGGGRTDTKGFALKGAYAPAANWTLAGTLFINKLNNDTGSTGATATRDLDYNRLQLDLNYKF
jgi:hypothetical protein